MTNNTILVSLTIAGLKSIDVDGETMEHIVNSVGLSEQLLRQLVLKADETVLNGLIEERKELSPKLSPKEAHIKKIIDDVLDSLKRSTVTRRSTCNHYNWSSEDYMFMPEAAERLQALGYTVRKEYNHGVNDFLFGSK